MATKRTLDNLVEAANMIEKAKGTESDQFCENSGDSIAESLRRAQMRGNFNMLQELLPSISGQKASNVNILKEATGVILKLKKEDVMYQSEKAKLTNYKESLKAKMKLLQDSLKTEYSDISKTVGKEAVDEPLIKHSEPSTSRQSCTTEIGINTDFTLFDSDDDDEDNIVWGTDKEVHIEIED